MRFGIFGVGGISPDGFGTGLMRLATRGSARPQGGEQVDAH